MNKYIARLTSSARGEAFNPLTWPFLFSMLAYGVGFVSISITGATAPSTLYVVMLGLGSFLPLVWGVIAILNIVGGVTFLLFNVPPFGKITGLVGFMLWLFAGFGYILAGGWLPLIAVVLPNMFFWIWQYLSLMRFRAEDVSDEQTMARYNRGEYDDIDPEVDSEQARLDNRGVDEQ